jgi:2-dehydro-3-deoxygluconokinase
MPAAMPTPPVPRIALFGECMIELRGTAFGSMTQGYGGDTLNTAVYLARCGGAQVAVSYATALGDDPLSTGMMTRWSEQGIGLSLVRRLPGRMPGLYLIQVDDQGERHFSYWRDQAAARAYFDTDRPTPLEADPPPCDWLYFSGISLAILPPDGRARLLQMAAALRERGGRVVFDNNHRPRLWPHAPDATAAYEAAFATADIALVTLDDHQAWLARSGRPADADAALAHAAALPAPEVVIKRGAEPTLLRLLRGGWQAVATERVAQVVDTTAAGDSFAGAYVACRSTGGTPLQAAALGNRVAARVVQHAGAVIPAGAMADLMAAAPSQT